MEITAAGVDTKYKNLKVFKSEDPNNFIPELGAKRNTKFQTSQPKFVIIFYFLSCFILVENRR